MNKPIKTKTIKDKTIHSIKYTKYDNLEYLKNWCNKHKVKYDYSINNNKIIFNFYDKINLNYATFHLKKILDLKSIYLNDKSLKLFKIGNVKVNYDSIVFSLGNATNCINRFNGNCQLKNPNNCYAYKEELIYKSCKHFRNKQYKYFLNNDINNIVKDIIKVKNIMDNKKSKVYIYPKIKYIRLNESNDIKTLNEFKKIKQLAIKLRKYGITIYTYSSSNHLNKYFKKHKVSNLILNGSNNMLDNRYKVITKKDLDKYKNKSKYVFCKNDCNICNYCKYKHKNTIIQILHK